MMSKTVRFLSQNRPGRRMGMGHYERLLLKHLSGAAAPGEWAFEIVFDGRKSKEPVEPKPLAGSLSSARFSGFSAGRMTGWPWWATRSATRVLSGGSGPSLYHSLALSYPAPANRPAVYTIHDLPPARFDDEGTVPRWARQAAQRAQAIMTPSAFAKAELVELLDLSPERVHVVPYGCETEEFNTAVQPADDEQLQRHGLGRPFFIYSGGFTRRKNLRALLNGWKSIAERFPEHTLALAGPREKIAEIAADVAAPRVVVLGYLERVELRSLMKAAELLVCPSIYEGFGLPPLEAMAMGVPVVAVRAGAVPEVTGDAALLADDGDPESLADVLRRALENESLRRDLATRGPARAVGFSWKCHAEQVLNLYRRVLSA
jgi:alpha-1,3-rhamnosyl/mannosyltransferase